MLKIVVIHEAANTTFANAFIVPDHYNRSLETFKELVDAAKKDLGKGKEDIDFECGVIIKSRSHKNMPCVRFSFDPETPIPEGWQRQDSLEFYLA